MGWWSLWDGTLRPIMPQLSPLEDGLVSHQESSKCCAQAAGGLVTFVFPFLWVHARMRREKASFLSGTLAYFLTTRFATGALPS